MTLNNSLTKKNIILVIKLVGLTSSFLKKKNCDKEENNRKKMSPKLK